MGRGAEFERVYLVHVDGTHHATDVPAGDTEAVWWEVRAPWADEPREVVYFREASTPPGQTPRFFEDGSA